MIAGNAIPASDATAIRELCQRQQAFFDSGVTRSYAFRKGQLQVLKSAIQRHEERLLAALQEDLNKSGFEAYGTEIGLVYEEINYAAKHLKQWMQPQRAAMPLMFFPSSGKIYREPLGVTLIISAWNYPLMLLLSPLVSAIAGGNTCILKPAEMAGATEKVLIDLVQEIWEDEYIAVVSGRGEWIGEHLISQQQLGHIFFTGSTATGKKIMAAAASQLTPVTLELGGKSPGIVAADAQLDFAAKKIAWSKWINAGQTCVAVDYLLVHESIYQQFLPKLIQAFRQMMGDDPRQNTEYARIINARRFAILEDYLQEATILYGGERDADRLFFAPCIVSFDNRGVPAMQEEIFGPILPVITYRDYPEAMEIVREHPQPLALYLFTENRKLASLFVNGLSFGGGCINNTLIHLGIPGLPFGGVGNSGMGRYHGKDGFDTFTRKKSMVSTPSRFDLKYWYPPFRDHLRLLKWLMK